MHPYLLLGASLSLASQASAACTRAQLQDAVTAYINAQASGQVSTITALASSSINYTENDAVLDITKGVLAQPITIDFNRSMLDTTQCATFTELTAATSKHPYVIHTRMLFADDKIATMQSVVTDDGDWAFNATGHLAWTKQEKWDPIPEAKRDSRDVIKAAGDAYLDSWGDGSVKVPYGTPCARLEGGSYTGGGSRASANTCKMPQFPQPFKITNRRYVIDEEIGGLDIFNNFPFIEKTKPDGTPSSNFIRVEGGSIRYIHEATACATRNCGR
ncbi:hypothetical protein CONLIGDRAFT_581244 [Coniochaeta ligniaria NRRL 30616]|uniref:DUF8021 domain-containing protein n=1 Tax=Coniochaeta ligniaria NRRL 30616 TaxID=1408157 RepID=A0A1J7IH59_9PEZI|nr:hypothetical protein CONLIGDRAFT_581244 [Coniochaeta ligniaria NRRL 30616]